MLELAVLGTLAFWVFIAINIAMLALIEFEKPGWATVTIGLWIAAMWYFDVFNVWVYAKTNPWGIVIYIAAYLIIGVLWGLFKWWRFVAKRFEIYLRLKKEFLISKKLPADRVRLEAPMPEDLREEWTKSITNNPYDNRGYYLRHKLDEVPDYTKHKDLITSWGAFWPWSMLWTVINDPVRRFFSWAYENLGKAYDRIAQNTYGKALSDVVELAEEESPKGRRR